MPECQPPCSIFVGFHQLSIRAVTAWSKEIAPLDWDGREGMCNLLLCCSPPLSAGWELRPQCSECSMSSGSKGAGTTDRRSETASNHCPLSVHPSWTDEIMSLEHSRLLLELETLLSWAHFADVFQQLYCSSFSDTYFHRLIQGQRANIHLFCSSLSSLDENWKLCLHLM